MCLFANSSSLALLLWVRLSPARSCHVQVQNNPLWLQPVSTPTLALLNALDVKGVDVSYDCVRGITLVNGTCGPQCSTDAKVVCASVCVASSAL